MGSRHWKGNLRRVNTCGRRGSRAIEVGGVQAHSRNPSRGPFPLTKVPCLRVSRKQGKGVAVYQPPTRYLPISIMKILISILMLFFIPVLPISLIITLIHLSRTSP